MAQCPFYPEEPAGEIKCDFLVAKEPAYKADYVKEFCKGRFKDCAYYFHLSRWMERIKEAMEEEEDEDEA